MANEKLTTTNGDTLRLDEKKSYEITIPAGVVASAEGLLEHEYSLFKSYHSFEGYNITDDKFIFEVPDKDIAKYSVRVHGQDYDSNLLQGHVADKADGYYILLEKQADNGKKELVSSIKLTDCNWSKFPERIKGEKRDFSDIIQIKASDGVIHKIAAPVITKEIDGRKPLTDENVIRVNALMDMKVPSDDVEKAVFALKKSLGPAPTDQQSDEALIRVLQEAKAKVDAEKKASGAERK